MPVTKTLPYNWFDTPNLHMSTIKDFYFLCKIDRIHIMKSISVTDNKSSNINYSNLNIKNLISEIGVFLITK